MKLIMAKRALVLAFIALVLPNQAFSQSLFAKAKEDANKSLVVYKSVLKDYFSQWSTLLSAAPETDESGQPAFRVNPSERFLRFKMIVSVNESAYSGWKASAFAKLAEAGIHETGEGGTSIGGTQWAFPNQDGIDKWLRDKDISMPEMTFRAMLIDAEGGVIRSVDFHEVKKAKIVTTVHEAMLRSWTEVQTNTVETLPLAWSERLKESSGWETTDWNDKAKDGDSCFIWVCFDKLTDEEMERAASVKCLVLSDTDLANERITAARTKWAGREEEAEPEVLQILADMIKVPGMEYSLGRFKVRQSQWEVVMDNNPADWQDKEADNPVVGAKYDEVEEFIARLNSHPAIASIGVRFRLPTKSEWKTAALAGAPGEFMRYISRYGEARSENGGENAWGFHDMLVGCWERIAQTDQNAGWLDDGWYACAGGTERNGETQLLACPIGHRSDHTYVERSDVGIRLCADWSDALEMAIDEAKTRLAQMEDIPVDRHAAIQSILNEMVSVPGTDVQFGKFEVTQLQWVAVMGSNPSTFKGANRPVENIAMEDIEKFIELLNASEEVSAAGLHFRLPKKEEWITAALAGGNTIRKQSISEGKYGLLADGTEGKPNDIAWHGGYKAQFSGEETIPPTSNGMTHPVGKKTPNAFGLYDMHGNVKEVVSQRDHFKPFVTMGGSWNSMPQYCSADSNEDLWDNGSVGSREVGIRLCAESVTEKPIRTQTKQK